MNRSINDVQLQVLRWVADGADLDNPPIETFKKSAIALKDRKLIRVSKSTGKWNATITEAGSYYLEHGRYPQLERASSGRNLPAPPKRSSASNRSPTAPGKSPKGRIAVNAKPGPTPAEPQRLPGAIDIPTQLRRPHTAVREIIDHKARLDVPSEQRQRALLILHALVQEAVRRDWTVSANPSTIRRDPWTDRRTRVSPGADLFTIDAGDKPVAIRLRMRQKRVEHKLTDEEIARKERYSWSYAPKYDFEPTDRMRLEIREGSTNAYGIEDTAATYIEDKLIRAIERIEEASVKQRELVERWRQRDIEIAEERRRAEIFRQRAERYSSWFETLEQLRSDVARHRELTDTVERLRSAINLGDPTDENLGVLGEYLAWSEQHLEDSDPLRAIRLPKGERPDLSYEEWREWTRRNFRSHSGQAVTGWT
ncbi:hypothetical protein [Brevibacterium oceani]|uniref:hypothetical protein n=1 Tax=Brevibacterium oceani TaxID=358099 RepID=UPI001B31B1A3|nr:hypothetical protein [Brevibacterium oceani]